MFRKAIHKMAPYVPGEQPRPGERLVKLNTNENPYPPFAASAAGGGARGARPGAAALSRAPG